MRNLPSIYERSRVPLYLQVASVMRQRIEAGHWAHGEKISTLEELEKEFAVARVTIRQAVELLREEGLLDAQQGRGTFVSGQPKNSRWLNLANGFEAMVDSLKNNTLERGYLQEHSAPPDLAKGEGELAEAYTFLRSVQYKAGEPFSVVNLHLSREIFLRHPERFKDSAALASLVEMDDITLVHAYQTLSIGVAAPETADLLKIGLGEPTAECRLVLVDDKGIAIYVAGIHYHKDCFAIRSDLLKKTGSGRRKPMVAA